MYHFLIETYRPNNDGSLRLVNIDAGNKYSSKDAAQTAINTLLIEQIEDNNTLLQMYADKLEAQVMDIDTDDRILRYPTLYNYSFKATKYSDRQIKKLA